MTQTSNFISVLFSDPLFLAALVIFVAALIVPVVCIAAWKKSRRLLGAESEMDNQPSETPPDQQSEPIPETPVAGAPMPPPAPAQGPAHYENETAVVYSVMEERFAELARRMASLETPGGKAAGNDPLQDILQKRLAILEEEVRQLKQMLTAGAGAPSGTLDLTKLTGKVETLQRILENLTTETEAAKPS